MNRPFKKLILVPLLFIAITSNAQTPVAAPPGITITANPVSTTAIGRAGGETETYTNPGWPVFASPCYMYGFRDTLYGAINGNNNLPPGSGCSGSSDLVYNAAQSNLVGGILVYLGTTNYRYLSAFTGTYTTSTLSVRATITVTNTSAVPIPILSFGFAKLFKANQNFNVNFLMEAFSPSDGTYFAGGGNTWTPCITLYDNLHTDPSTSICTSFGWGTYYTFTVNTTALNTGPYCSGATINLSSSATTQDGAALTYSWTGPSYSATGANQTIPNATTAMSGTYSVVATESWGCAGTGSTVVTVNPTPTVSATALPATICSGGSTTLTGSGATTYLWMPGSLSGTSVSVSPATTTTYTVTGTSGICSSTANVTVTVNPSPTVSATALPTTICSGGSTTLTGSGATTYSWMPGSLSGTSVSVSPATTTTYTVTGTSGTCSSTANVTVTVNPTPTVSATASPSTICSGSSTTLTGSGATTYSWLPGSLSGTSVSVSPATTTTYTVTGTLGTCSSTANVTVTVNPTPTVSATASPSTICSGSSTTLTGSGAITYSWLPGSLSGTSVSVSPATTTTYTVTGTLGTCSSTANVTVTVNPTPTVSATASPSTICSGSSTTLTGSGATTYSWLPGSLSGTSVSVSPATTTTYTVTGTLGTCPSTGNVTVTVNPTPTVSATASPSTICSGSSTTLTGSGATTYSWLPGSLSGTSVSVSPATTTTYTVTGTLGTCSSTANVTVTVNPTPTVSATASPSTICSGNSTTLTGSGATTYSWLPGSLSGTSVSVSPGTTTTYTVTGTLGTCTSTANVTVTVNPTPTVSATASPSTICSGTSTTLTGSGATTYTWMPGSLSGTSVTDTPGTTTTYTVTGTLGTCTSTANVVVTVNPTPVVTATANPSTICAGDPTTLTGSGATTYTWMPGSLSGSSVTDSPSTTTTYTMTGTLGTCTRNTNVTVTVNPTPTVVATTTNPTICNGGSTSLSATGALGYLWTPGNIIGSTITVSPAVTTTYTVTGINASGCTDADIIIITVNPLPVVTANSSAPAVCTGNSVTLTGGGATSYTWDNSVIDGVSFVPASTLTYVVTGTDGNGCANTASTIVTVNPLPTVVANSSAAAVCIGNSVTLTGSGATSYTWDNSVTDGISFVPSSTLTYNVTGTDGNGCTNTDATTVTVNPLPTVIANSSASVVCAGNSVTLTGSGATSYTWDNSVTDGISFVPSSTLTYNVIGTDGNGCTNTDATTVTVNPLPTVVANSSAAAVCTGNSVTLTGSGATSYTWDNSVTDGISFVPSSTLTYIVTGTDGNGCVNIDSTVVTVNVLPTVVANSSAPAVCIGNSVTLTGSGATSYTWDNSVTDGISFVPSSTLTYNVIGTDGNGCTNSASTTVTVNPLPLVTANSSAAAVCTGNSVTLTGGGATSYTWDNSVTDGISFVPASTLTYNVIGTDGNGCTNSANTTVTVNPLPTVIANSSAAAVCAGNSVTLTGSGATSYTWDNSVTDGISFVPASTLTYNVIGTDGNGCTNSASTTVTVNPLPVVTANSSSPAVCIGNSVTLTGGGATSYTWNNSVTDGISFAPASTLTYVVTGTDGNGCVNMDSTIVTVNLLPTVVANSTAAAVCTGNSVTLTGSGATSYTWDNSVTDGISFVPASTLTYNVIGTDGNGCTNSASTTVTVNPLPVVTANSTASTVCAGNSIILTGGGATSYTWDNSVTDGISFVPASTLTYNVIGTDGNGCTNTANTTVTVNPLPAVAANASADSVCTGSSVTFTGSGASSYSWSGGVTDGVSFVPASTLSYTVSATDINGCTGSDSVTVFVDAAIGLITSGTSPICNGQSSTLTATPSGGVAPFTFNWSNSLSGSGPQTVSPAATVTYTVSITDSLGCSSSVQNITVTVNPTPTATLQSSANVSCFGGTNGTATVNATGGTPSYSYAWLPAGGTSATGTNLSNGSFTCTITDANGCITTQSVILTQPTIIQLTNANTSEHCGHADGSASILASGGTPGFTYVWSNSASNDTISNLTAGSYNVVVTDANGCTTTSTVVVGSSSGPVANAGSSVTITAGQSTTLNGTGGSTYSWSPATDLSCSICQNTNASPSVTTVYTLTVTDANGCTATDVVTVFVDNPCGDLFIPNAFSPNGDNANDTFYVRGNCIKYMDLQIFDRWGEKVFSSTDPSKGWDGTWNGTKCEPATFTYFLRATMNNNDQIEKQGTISLIK